MYNILQNRTLKNLAFRKTSLVRSIKKGDDAMNNIMSPSVSEITAGQIGKLQEILAARLRKSGLRNDAVQQVLENQGDEIADEMVGVVRRRVEAVSDMIVRHVKVDRSLTPYEMVAATRRAEYVDKAVAKTMPRNEGDEVDIYFFKVGRDVTVVDFAEEYELRGLKPDYYAQGAVNEADPAFADEHPNGTQWQDKDGNICCLAFNGLDGGRRVVFCNRDRSSWFDYWWFAGVRK